MKQYFFPLILGVSLFALAPRANALTVTAQPVGQDTIYSDEVDALVLDVTVMGTPGDTIRTLVVRNDGQQLNSSSIDHLTLWRDSGPLGFQGWKQDTLLAQATINASDTWAFELLNIPLPSEGVRLFVTLTAGRVSARRRIQFSLPALSDANQNRRYDTGDLGIFTAEGDTGPREFVTTSDTQFVSNIAGEIAPQSAITDPAHGASVEKGKELRINGASRSRGGSSATGIQLRIGKSAAIDMLPWIVVKSGSLAIDEWQYAWTPSETGILSIQSRAIDANGVSEEPHAITVTVIEPAVVASPPIPPLDPYQAALVRVEGSSAVYYVYNAARWVFPNEKIYYSWYPDFRSVKTVSLEALAKWHIAGAVTYRPGTRFVKLQTDPKVYAVSRGGVLRWVSTEATAQKLFGAGWSTLVDDLSDAFFSNYRIGELLDENTHYSMSEQQNSARTIAEDKGL